MKDNLKLHSRKAVAEILCCSVRQTYRLADLPKPVVLGAGRNSKRLFVESELKEWIESKRQQGGSK